MRSALAKGLDVPADSIEIDYSTKVVDMKADGVTLDAIDQAFEGTRYARSDS